MATAKVFRLTCGILFNHSFSILDRWGSIADTVLYKNSYFNPEYFPEISSQYTTNRHLENPKEGHRLQLNSENLVYTHTVVEDFEKEYNAFVERMKKFLIPEIVEKNDLVIRRIGMVYICEMDTEAVTKFTSQFFKPELSEVLDCRFSKRCTVPQSLTFSGTDDYINKIYSVGNANEKSRGISFDYQLFFNPPIVDIKPRAARFFENSKTAFYDEIYREEYRGK